MLTEILKYIDQNIFAFGLVFLFHISLIDEKMFERLREKRIKKLFWYQFLFFINFYFLLIYFNRCYKNCIGYLMSMTGVTNRFFDTECIRV